MGEGGGGKDRGRWQPPALRKKKILYGPHAMSDADETGNNFSIERRVITQKVSPMLKKGREKTREGCGLAKSGTICLKLD